MRFSTDPVVATRQRKLIEKAAAKIQSPSLNHFMVTAVVKRAEQITGEKV